MVMHFNRLQETGAWQERVEDAADPLRTAVSRKEIEYKFFVLDSDAVNAFSHPGGYVYVTRGLLEWLGEDEDLRSGSFSPTRCFTSIDGTL